MPRSLTTPDRLFDRTWRPGHPFRPRLSSRRRWTMTVVFVVLCAVIGAYWYITDSIRVRNMAESYLTALIGGPVEVGKATLSIFEGLRLDDVRVYVDSSDRSDSQLFAASSFIIEYNPAALLNGQIEATRIAAIEPRVYLTEDTETGRWNYQRLRGRGATTRRSPGLPDIEVLPQIVLRNAQVEYSRYHDGQTTDRGAITIEGQLTPTTNGRYAFQFQSLGRRQGVGPLVRGDVVLATGQVTAELLNFEFGEDIKAMLPGPVHRWCEQHGLAGSVDVKDLTFAPGGAGEGDGGEPEFHARIDVQGVKLTVTPEEWMGAEEITRMNELRHATRMLRAAGLNGRHFVDRLCDLVEPAPLQLRDVDATFVFTDRGIRIQDLTGKLEDIAFRINGTIDGYNPAAPADIHIASIPTRNIEIPATPHYVASMPPAVREVYDRFRPRGTAAFKLNLHRPEPDARPRVTGAIDIIDGSFTFENFPYPVHNATGRIVLGHNASNGYDSLRIDRIRGTGQRGGPNAEAQVEISGEMGPFTPDIGVEIVVTGRNVSSEPALIAAFPRATRDALKVFDAPGKGEFPRFSGDFVCRIVRLPQRKSKWIIETDVNLRDAAGMLVAFPYPMSGVSGELKIRDDHVQILGATMQRGDASLRIDGRVDWGRRDRRDEPWAARNDDAPRAVDAKSPATQPSLRPDLKITARNVPIDRDLLEALPPDRRAMLERLGVQGAFDLDGTISVAPTARKPEGELAFDFKIGVKNGSFWPEQGTFALSDARGSLRLTPTELIISNLTARRDAAQLNASGSVSWPTEPPQLVLRVDADNLDLDSALYNVLPAAAQRGWDQVRPEGTVDVTLSYSGVVARQQTAAATDSHTGVAATQPVDPPATAPALDEPGQPGGFELVIKPRKLAATPQALPYRLDELDGTLTVLPDKVIVKDLTARHGKTRVMLSAVGSLSKDGAWDFQVAADDVIVDDDLRRAAPTALAELIDSIELAGELDFEFSKLRILTASTEASPPDPGAAGGSTTTAATRPADPIDVDFAVKLSTDGAAMQVGVPLTDVNGSAELSGSVRGGKLHELSGRVDAKSLTLASRPASDFHATLFKPAEHQAMQISRMEARLAGGTLAGQVDWAFPDDAPSRYAVALVLRNADVKQLTGNLEQDIRGQLSASLNLEGAVNDPTSRRGRGDVSVGGEQLYQIPLVLGLLQITELALPLTGPFRDGSARYSIDGQRVTFEQIELRSKEMLMQGDGYLDFAKKQVRMTFVTDARGWPKLPLIGDLMQSARNELLQIHVRGTLQEPKVSARSMNTFTTTIDEVLRGEDRAAKSE